MQKARMIVAVIILVLSLALLAWGLWPEGHVRRELPIAPTQMTLPTPSSFVPSPDNAPQVSSLAHVEGPKPAGRSGAVLPLPCSNGAA